MGAFSTTKRNVGTPLPAKQGRLPVAGCRGRLCTSLDPTFSGKALRVQWWALSERVSVISPKIRYFDVYVAVGDVLFYLSDHQIITVNYK